MVIHLRTGMIGAESKSGRSRVFIKYTIANVSNNAS